MKRLLIVLFAVVAVGLAAAGFIFWNKSDQKPKPAKEAAAPLAAQSTPQVIADTIGSLTWELSTDSTLTISGEGVIDVSNDWYSYEVKRVIIKEGVTGIGDGAFWEYYTLTSVTLPESLTSIGKRAFAECQELTSITLPESLTSIGAYAFSDCYALTSITIPDGVTSIGKAAFGFCEALNSITIPAGVTNIGSGAFYECISLTTIDVAAGSQHFTSEDGVLFDKSKTTLICYPAGKSNTTYIVPDEVTRIGEGAFSDCSALTSITLPKSITSIERIAFMNCTSSVTCLAIVPPQIGESINVKGEEANTENTLYVPAESVEAYRNSAWGKAFTTITAIQN